jgi:hypothetical protein
MTLAQPKYTTFEDLEPYPLDPIEGRLTERDFRAKVVRTILAGRAEQALSLLSQFYGVTEPRLRVGTVKRHRQVLACYVEKEKRIYLSRSDFLMDPFVLLHEFYHHLRASQVGRSRQVEKRADLFALNFIRDYRSVLAAFH